MKKRNLFTLFDVSLCSTNLGDQIITEFIKKELDREIQNNQVVSIPSHDFMGIHSYKLILRSKIGLVGGSNLLSSNMPFYRQWKLRIQDILIVKNNLLFGVGWWQYQKRPNIFTKILLKRILSKNLIHSVRDGYTKEMLSSIGIHNVINTGCPTMWGLDENHCSKIPTTKSSNVITTITDYNFDLEEDVTLIKLLISSYSKVYIWLQGDNDIEKLRKAELLQDLIIVAPNLSSYRDLLNDRSIDLDYIGTRLHAGIYALNHMRRSLIITIDNRAIEISKDTLLPTVKRGDIEATSKWINSDSPTSIKINQECINKFRNQLELIDKNV